MTVESATYIASLNASGPPSSDGVTEGDDHLRLIKAVLQSTFPSTTGVFVDLVHTWSLAQSFTAAPLPTTTNGAALGSTSKMWSDLFLASGAVVNFNNGNYTLTHSAGILTASGVFAAASTIELGHATDTTLARSSAGNVSIEGNLVYRAGGTDVPVTDGGTGSSTAAAGFKALAGGITNDPFTLNPSFDRIPIEDNTDGSWGMFTISDVLAAASTNLPVATPVPGDLIVFYDISAASYRIGALPA